MVPCLHQCKVYMKRKLRVCRAQKCSPSFSAKSQLRTTGLQKKTVPCSAVYGRQPKFAQISGLPFANVPCLHQCNIYIKKLVRECIAHKCNPCFGAKSPLRSTGLQTTRFHAAPYRADSTNLPQFGANFRHGTVFAPM